MNKLTAQQVDRILALCGDDLSTSKFLEVQNQVEKEEELAQTMKQLAQVDFEIELLKEEVCYGDEYGTHNHICVYSKIQELHSWRDRLKMRIKYPDGMTISHVVRF